MYRSEKLNTREESEANNLAADLLMPRRLVNDFFRQGILDVDSLAKRFDVSVPAMRVRLRYLYQLEYA
jgi:Zn-dependent peptidase ImmA (M78 family)